MPAAAALAPLRRAGRDSGRCPSFPQQPASRQTSPSELTGNSVSPPPRPPPRPPWNRHAVSPPGTQSAKHVWKRTASCILWLDRVSDQHKPTDNNDQASDSPR